MKSCKLIDKTLMLVLVIYPTLVYCFAHETTVTLQTGEAKFSAKLDEVKQMESPVIVPNNSNSFKVSGSQEYGHSSSSFPSSNSGFVKNPLFNTQIRTVAIKPMLVPISGQSVHQEMQSIQNYNLQNKLVASSNNRPIGMLESNYLNKQNSFNQVCPCAAYYKCSPCGSLSYKPPISCRCAPKLTCQKCPPLSMIHEVASFKAIQDQKLASELKNISNKMSEIFKSISIYAGDELRYELEAKDSALKMEESSLKAQLAKQQMERISDQARLVAQRTVSRCNDCIPSEIEQQGLYNQLINNKVFPEEVDSIGEYMQGTFSINGSSYADAQSEAQFMTTDDVEKENRHRNQANIQSIEPFNQQQRTRPLKMTVIETNSQSQAQPLSNKQVNLNVQQNQFNSQNQQQVQQRQQPQQS